MRWSSDDTLARRSRPHEAANAQISFLRIHAHPGPHSSLYAPITVLSGEKLKASTLPKCARHCASTSPVSVLTTKIVPKSVPQAAFAKQNKGHTTSVSVKRMH